MNTTKLNFGTPAHIGHLTERLAKSKALRQRTGRSVTALDGLISSVQTHLELVWSERVEPGSVRRWLIEELDAHRASLEQALGTQDEGDWG